MAGLSEDGEREVRVLLVDDDPLVRGALALMLDGSDGIRVVGEVGDGAQVPAAVDAHRPDVVLMDLRMPDVDGVRATERLRARPDPPEVVVLTTFDADRLVAAALRAGAAGFLLKDTPPREIVAAVRRAVRGEPTLSPSVTRRLMDQTAGTATTRAEARRSLQGLTARELDVLRCVARGLSNAEIGTELGMGVATVKSHVTRVLATAGVENRTRLALLARDAGLG